MLYEILTASKSDLATEEAVKAALKEAKPGFAVENITGDDKEWTVRLVAADDAPPFLKKKDDDSDSDSADSDSADDDSSDDSDSDSDSDSDGDSESDDDNDGDGKGKNDANPAAEVKGIINQLTQLFKEMGGKVEELQAAHDDKADKLKDIADTAGGGGPEGDMPPGLPGAGPGAGDVGPVPGGPPRPPMPGSKMDKRKPGVPPVPGGGLPTFTNYQVVRHPGVDEDGNKISLTAAATVLEADEEFSQYEVVGMTENADGSFSAKLKLKSLK